MALKTNHQTLDVEIERILPGGVGLAHANGLTVFVSLAAPGDFVRVNVNRKRGKLAFATVLEVLKASPVRVEPPCPYFGRCGGCDFQQLAYEAQLDAKLEIVRDCLHRIARIENVPEISIHPSPQQWQYRSRTNWQFDPQRRKLGYFEGASHSVCDVEFCAVLAPELQGILEKLREDLREGEILTDANEIDAVAGDEGVSVAPAVNAFDTLEIRRTIGNETYYFNAASFFQINHALLPQLVEVAIGPALKEKLGGVAIDLYCGVGLFTLPLSRRFSRVIGVEANPVAVRFAERNVQDAGLTNVQIVNARVSEWLLDDEEEAGAPPVDSRAIPGSVDFLLLDPPRAGAEPSALEGILKMRPKEISYVSCDPATLARDLKILLAEDYFLDSVTAFDMFPQTHHVETVSRLVQSTS